MLGSASSDARDRDRLTHGDVSAGRTTAVAGGGGAARANVAEPLGIISTGGVFRFCAVWKREYFTLWLN